MESTGISRSVPPLSSTKNVVHLFVVRPVFAAICYLSYLLSICRPDKCQSESYRRCRAERNLPAQVLAYRCRAPYCHDAVLDGGTVNAPRRASRKVCEGWVGIGRRVLYFDGRCPVACEHVIGHVAAERGRAAVIVNADGGVDGGLCAFRVQQPAPGLWVEQGRGSLRTLVKSYRRVHCRVVRVAHVGRLLELPDIRRVTLCGCGSDSHRHHDVTNHARAAHDDMQAACCCV